MTLHSKEPKRPTYFIPNFELRSVLLFAALSMGAATSARAQTSAGAPGAARNGAPSQMALSGATGAIPPTKATGNELDAAFTRADTDGDGRLSRQEAEHFPVLAPRFKQIGRDGDRVISRDEFNRAATR